MGSYQTWSDNILSEFLIPRACEGESREWDGRWMYLAWKPLGASCHITQIVEPYVDPLTRHNKTPGIPPEEEYSVFLWRLKNPSDKTLLGPFSSKQECLDEIYRVTGAQELRLVQGKPGTGELPVILDQFVWTNWHALQDYWKHEMFNRQFTLEQLVEMSRRIIAYRRTHQDEEEYYTPKQWCELEDYVQVLGDALDGEWSE